MIKINIEEPKSRGISIVCSEQYLVGEVDGRSTLALSCESGLRLTIHLEEVDVTWLIRNLHEMRDRQRYSQFTSKKPTKVGGENHKAKPGTR